MNISELQLSRLVSKEINSRHTIVDLREKCYSEALRVSKNTLETLDPSILNFSMLAKKLITLELRWFLHLMDPMSSYAVIIVTF